MKPATVSVIIPCYNQGKFLGDALKSVIAQSFPNWECIVVNDGSTDNTRDVALQFASSHSRIKYVEQGNRGLAAARNAGLQHIRGTHVQFLDSDDAIAPEKFKRQLEVAAGVTGLCVVYSDHYFASATDVTRDLGLTSGTSFVLPCPLWDIATRWETELSVPLHSFLFDARIFTESGIRFSEELANHEDWDCCMRVFALDVTIMHVQEKLAAYRIHSQSMCRTTSDYAMWKGFTAAIIRQQRIWQHDLHLSKLLSDKLRHVEVQYGYSRNPLRALSLMIKQRTALGRHLRAFRNKVRYGLLRLRSH